MIDAPLGPIVAASASVKAMLGTDPVRFWEFGEAVRDGEGRVQAPYAVWQTVYGSPENYLASRPDVDRWGVQIDAYADTPEQVRELAKRLRDALEPHAYVVAYNGTSKDVPTNLRRYSFTMEWLTSR